MVDLGFFGDMDYMLIFNEYNFSYIILELDVCR